MSRTKRNASFWVESRFKLGDPDYPKDNETHYFNGRYQAKVRNKNCSFYCTKMDPLTMKTTSWSDNGKWAKDLATRSARHMAKILIIKMVEEIFIEQMQDLEDQLIDDDWYYGDDYISYFDEAYDYAEFRYQQELDNKNYDDDLWSTYGLYEN